MPRKKRIEEEPEEKVEWDKKKIAIASLTLAGLIGGGIFFKHIFFGSQNSSQQQSVIGVSSSQSQDNSSSNQNNSNIDLPSLKSIGQGVQTELNNLQKQASSISLAEVASSSPQVKQIIQQLQQLPSLPSNVAKQTCEQLCGKL